MAFWLYIVECADKSFYIGHTDNLDERMRLHDLGVDGSYTASRRPLTLVYAQELESRYEALALEHKLKGWSKAKKLALIAGDWNEIHKLAKGKHRHER